MRSLSNKKPGSAKDEYLLFYWILVSEQAGQYPYLVESYSVLMRIGERWSGAEDGGGQPEQAGLSQRISSWRIPKNYWPGKFG